MLTNILVTIVAAIHVYIVILEMLLWEKPAGRKAFGTTAEFAKATRVLAANQGLYNGFLAAGLVWGLLAGASGICHKAVLPRLRARGGPVRRRHRLAEDPLHTGAAGRAGAGRAVHGAVRARWPQPEAPAP